MYVFNSLEDLEMKRVICAVNSGCGDINLLGKYEIMLVDKVTQNKS